MAAQGAEAEVSGAGPRRRSRPSSRALRPGVGAGLLRQQIHVCFSRSDHGVVPIELLP